MNKEELDLLEIVFTLAIGECAYNDINDIQKLEDKIKTINNLCKKQKEVIDKAIEYIEKDYSYTKRHDIPLLTKDEQLAGKLLDILKEVE